MNHCIKVGPGDFSTTLLACRSQWALQSETTNFLISVLRNPSVCQLDTRETTMRTSRGRIAPVTSSFCFQAHLHISKSIPAHTLAGVPGLVKLHQSRLATLHQLPSQRRLQPRRGEEDAQAGMRSILSQHRAAARSARLTQTTKIRSLGA